MSSCLSIAVGPLSEGHAATVVTSMASGPDGHWRDFTVDSGGIRLAARDYGGSGRPVVLLHGGPGPTLATWNSFAPRLTGKFRVYAFDARGQGQSGYTEELSYPALAGDVEAVIQDIGADRPLVVGHSWGGQIAVAHAALFDSPSAVVLVDGLVTETPSIPADQLPRLELALRDGLAKEPTISFVGTAEEFRALIEKVRPGASDNATQSEIFWRTMIQGPDGLWRCRYSVDQLVELNLASVRAASYLSTDLYERIACPVMFVGALHSGQGRKDWPFSREKVAALRERFPWIQERWLDCGHFTPAEKPEELQTLIEEFADSISC